MGPRERLIGLSAALFLAACSGGTEEAGDDRLSGRIEITGSSTVAPLVNEIAQRFEAEHPGVRVSVQTGGSSRGLADARGGLADIGMSSRALTAEETDALVSHRLGIDGVALIVHGDNPVPALSREEVTAIFTGEVDDWRQVGGDGGTVTVVDKAAGRATREVFYAHFGLARGAVDADLVIGENLHGIRTVAGNRGAIGYVSVGDAARAAADGAPIRLLGLDGADASLEDVRAGRYPLSRDLILATAEDPPERVTAFIAFARSAAVHDLYADFGYVPATD